jgi:hypothetical protein
MKKISYIVALIMVVCWVVGYFSHKIGPSVHYLLAGALLLILINVIRDSELPENINQNKNKTL